MSMTGYSLLCAGKLTNFTDGFSVQMKTVDAKLIVHCVNTHHELVEALKVLRSAVELQMRCTCSPAKNANWCPRCDALRKTEALAKSTVKGMEG
jgi:hypothetical protein